MRFGAFRFDSERPEFFAIGFGGRQARRITIKGKVKDRGEESAAERFLTMFGMTIKSESVKKKQVPRSSG